MEQFQQKEPMDQQKTNTHRVERHIWYNIGDHTLSTDV